MVDVIGMIIPHFTQQHKQQNLIFIEGNATMLLHLIPPQGSLKC